MPKATAPRKPRRPVRAGIDDAMRTAYHEAGHAVLCTALDPPMVLVTIRPDRHRLGHALARGGGHPLVSTQIGLAGFAAEHLLTGRRSPQLRAEVEHAIGALTDPELFAAYANGLTDGVLVVRDMMSMAYFATMDDLRREIEQRYEIARESLAACWPAVKVVAAALLKKKELRWPALRRILGDLPWREPVSAVQRAHGIEQKLEEHHRAVARLMRAGGQMYEVPNAYLAARRWTV